MKKNFFNKAIFILSLICFFIICILIYNIAIYVDEAGISFKTVFGGSFGLYMIWIEMFVTFIITILSGIKLFIKDK